MVQFIKILETIYQYRLSNELVDFFDMGRLNGWWIGAKYGLKNVKLDDIVAGSHDYSTRWDIYSLDDIINPRDLKNYI